jgi:hypothetical protein
MSEFPHSSAEAPAQAAGYLFQVRFALYRALKRILRDPTGSIAVECADDVAISSGSEVTELSQLKHTATSDASFNDLSPQVWRSIGNWCRLLGNPDQIKLAAVDLVLVTNASIEEGSAISLLGPSDEERDPEMAVLRLREAALKSENATTKKDRHIFLALEQPVQLAVGRAVRIVGKSPNLAGFSRTATSGVVEKRPGGPHPPIFCKRIPARGPPPHFSTNKTNNSVSRRAASRPLHRLRRSRPPLRRGRTPLPIFGGSNGNFE